MSAPPRYTAIPFPPYRYLPGRTPHPTRDPGGHSIDHVPMAVADFHPERWAECETYLYGVDLHNHGYWWEAHEAFEACWRAVGKRGTVGRFLQALIQIGAAELKAHLGQQRAALGLWGDAATRVPCGGRLLGIDTATLTADLAARRADPAGPPLLLTLELPAD